MTARILVYNDEKGVPLVIDGVPTRTIANDILRNYPLYPQDVPLFASHQWGAAYGWLRNLIPQGDGLYADIELTPDGEQLVQSEAYKYVSPGLVYNLQLPNGDTLDGWTLVEISLTNMPAQYGGASIIKLERAIALAQPNWQPNDDPFDFPIEPNRDWDADATEPDWRKYVSNKDPADWTNNEWRRYRQRYLVYDAANPNQFNSYKLPVVALVDGKPHLFRRALIAAKAALAGARGGTNIPQNIKDTLIARINRTLEDITMTRDDLTQILTDHITPLLQRIEQIENTLRQQHEKQREAELEQTTQQLQREILSWRYHNDTEAIPPRIAQSYALMLARIPEPTRTELLLTLKHNPPITMPLTPTANNAIPTPNNPLTPLQQKYAEQLGVSTETFLKYNPQQEV